MLDALAAPGLVNQRRPVPDVDVREVRSMRMADVAPESLGVLIVDATTLDADVSVRGLRNMVAGDGLLVVLSAYASDLTEKAGVAIPAPAPFEGWDDLPVAAHGKAATYAVAQPLLPAKGVAPADFVAQVAGLNAELAKEIEARAATIHASRRGTIEKPVREMEAKQVWEALSTGATWTDDAAPAQKSPAVAEVESVRWTPQADFPLALIPYRTTESPLHQAQPPVLTKIYQESGLRPVGGTVRVHPETAAANRLEEGREAILRTRTGECRVVIRLDRLVQPGVLEAPMSPTRAELAGTARPSTPALLDLTAGARVTAARLERA
jgi:anaerobic selenocysteine-containing dehydrogenase